MKLKINSKDFQTRFISPILEVNKTNKSPIRIDGESIYCVSAIEGNKVYLYNTYKPVELLQAKDKFNINLAKLKSALSCLNAKETNFIDLEVNEDNLSYKGKDIKFNIKLLDDNVVKELQFNVKTLKNLNYVFTTTIKRDVVNDIKRAMDFASETTKFYFEQEDGKLYFMFGDKASNHNDTIKVFITNEFVGTISENIYDISILRLVFKFTDEIHIKVADNGALVLNIIQEGSELNYITTQLKK